MAGVDLFGYVGTARIHAYGSYALHKVFVFALENAPNVNTGSAFGKAALQKIFQTPIRILPFLTRNERRRLASRFAALNDSTDLPHAISALAAGCEVIVAYDEHFRAISTLTPYKTPEELL